MYIVSFRIGVLFPFLWRRTTRSFPFIYTGGPLSLELPQQPVEPKSFQDNICTELVTLSSSRPYTSLIWKSITLFIWGELPLTGSRVSQESDRTAWKDAGFINPSTLLCLLSRCSMRAKRASIEVWKSGVSRTARLV